MRMLVTAFIGAFLYWATVGFVAYDAMWFMQMDEKVDRLMFITGLILFIVFPTLIESLRPRR